MKYSDGQEVMLGDRVKLNDDPNGIVIALLDSKEFLTGDAVEGYGHMWRGAILVFPTHGSLHYLEGMLLNIELLNRRT